MKDLIARLEAATEGSRKLDMAVAVAFGWKGTPGFWKRPNSGEYTDLPEFTRSLDSALTLVPEGMVFSLGNDREFVWAWVGRAETDVPAYTGETPALALCVAALRAREPPCGRCTGKPC